MNIWLKPLQEQLYENCIKHKDTRGTCVTFDGIGWTELYMDIDWPMIRKFVIIVFFIFLMIHGKSDEIDVVIVNPNWHSFDGELLSLENPNTVSERSSRVFDLERFCEETGDLPEYPTESCLQKLNEYFSHVPIWRSSVVMVYQGTEGRSHPSWFDAGENFLGYNEIDFLQRDAPKWGDVFDGKEEERLDMVATVFGDSACLELTKQGKIRIAYLDRCAAVELFKYARYLEACVTGYSRREYFNRRVNNGLSTVYGRARKSMNPKVVVDYRIGNGWQLVENYLLSIWMNQKCNNLHFVAVNEFISGSSSNYKTVAGLHEQLRPMYKASIAIAARAGNSWAMKAYHDVESAGNIDYWKSVYEHNPLLFHRVMTTRLGAHWLSDAERILHAKQAYDLAAEVIPTLRESTFELYIRSQVGNQFSAGQLNSALRVIKGGQWRNKLVFPWDVVPNALNEINEKLIQYEGYER